MAIDQDAKIPATDEDRFHDIVAGRRIVRILSVRDLMIANRLFFRLMEFGRTRRLGRFFFGQIYDLGLANETQRMPELSFVSYERWPSQTRLPSDDPWRVTPDLVGLIVTPGCSIGDVETRVGEYLRAGVRMIWSIIPDSRDSRVTIVRRDRVFVASLGEGSLEGGDVLPGFRMSIASLFEDSIESD